MLELKQRTIRIKFQKVFLSARRCSSEFIKKIYMLGQKPIFNRIMFVLINFEEEKEKMRNTSPY